ncbi:galactosyltransferase-related protein [Parabacteroides provencensis]|uniref:galactosyltransferase-related protein n=1 Tax=Parabacteroides provencensis TaxID=1944636 RepID=UPI0013043E65|nr:galactosyltransferase-related protein [Parabacteroides provencensis]
MEQPLNICPQITYAIQLLSTGDNQDKAIGIIESVISDYDTKQYPNFSTGLAGIGAGIQYAINQQMIEAVADEVFVEIDEILFLSVCFRNHYDLSHAKGLTGLASYFFYRLEDKYASDNNICTLTSKSALLSILDILSARVGLNGYSYPLFKKIAKLSDEEVKDIKAFIRHFFQYNICNTQAELLQNRMIENMYYKENASCISANKNLDDLTILIPVRIDSTQRLENLYTMIEFYTSRTNARFILLEAGETQLVNITHYNHVEYIFCKDNNRIFHHTHYRNEMIKRAGTPIVAIWDIDIVVPLDQLYVAAEAIRKYGNVLSYPFDGCCYSIPEELSSKYRENPDIRLLENKHPVLSTMFGMLTVGGVFLANRKQYMRAGMENENFVGWGPEDAERLKRITILNLPVFRVPGSIYHLWHPRKENSCFANQEQNLKAKKELIRICRMNSPDLQNEINTWHWLDNHNQ